MRCLVVRFIDCEGPGIIADILKEKGYRITYHNAYQKGLHLIPYSHLSFDLILLMGGPQSVSDPNLFHFFEPYFNLVEGVLSVKKAKLIGVCLGSQIIAEVMGSKIRKGGKGPEVGFADCKILDKSSVAFQGINSETLSAFHLHEDTFDIPYGTKHLLYSEKYPSQMYSFEDRVWGIQAHLEPNADMLNVWKNVHKEFIHSAKVDPSDWLDKLKTMEATSRVIFRNMIENEV
jgi:GMP synthase-like glutamine amidotransferase